MLKYISISKIFLHSMLIEDQTKSKINDPCIQPRLYRRIYTYTHICAYEIPRDRPIICSSGQTISVYPYQTQFSLSVLSRAFLHVRTRHKYNLRGKRQESSGVYRRASALSQPVASLRRAYRRSCYVPLDLQFKSGPDHILKRRVILLRAIHSRQGIRAQNFIRRLKRIAAKLLRDFIQCGLRNIVFDNVMYDIRK